MWIEKLKTGKYRYAERYIEPSSGAYKRVSVTLEKKTAQTKKQAQEILNERIANIYEEYERKRLNIVTFREVVDRYLLSQKGVLKDSTLSVNAGRCNALCDVLGGDTLVTDLTARYVKECFMRANKPPSVLNVYLIRFKAVIRWAYKNDFIKDVSFLDKLERYKENKISVSTSNKFLEEFEYKAVLSALKKKRYKDLTSFLLLSGLRINEALPLVASDIDLQERVVHVTKSFEVSTKKVSTAKNASSMRDVFIQDELFELCKELKLDALANKLQYGCDYIFQKEGKPIQYNAYRIHLHTYCDGVTSKNVTPHIFRHTHASILAENGVDYETISRRLGHSKGSPITKEVYIHVTHTMQKRDRAQLNAVSFL